MEDKSQHEKLVELNAFYDASTGNQNSAVARVNGPKVKAMLAKLDKEESLDKDEEEQVNRWYEGMLERQSKQGARRRRGKPTKKKTRRGRGTRATRRTRSA